MNLRDSQDWMAHLKFSSLRTGLVNCLRTKGDAPGAPGGGTKRRLLFFELFVALSLSVTYYFLVENFAIGSPNNYTNGWVFTSCSIPGFHLDKLGDVWKGRLSGLLLSGWLFDSLVKDNKFGVGQYESLFGLYQSLWLFLLFLAVVFALRHSLFINLGIFAGLMYGFTPASGLYFYPWDLPATLFFTLAVLFFERRQMWLMSAAICAGCFFKETVLVCALLALFASPWKWRKRVLAFAGIVAVYLLGKKFLLSQLHFHVAAFSMNNATNLTGLFRPALLIENFKALLSPTLNHAIFVNAGTLVAVLALGWRRRFLPYMVVIVVYLGGQFMYGGLNEFRIFMQILPLSLIVLSERWQEYAGSSAAEELPAGSAPAWALRETFPVLMPLTIVLIGLSTGVAAWRYYDICENLRLDGRAPSELGKRTVEPEGHVSNLNVEYQELRSEYVKDELELARVSIDNQHPSDAINHYERVLEQDTNSVAAMRGLAWLRATASDPRLRNNGEALRLAERACQLTQNKEASLVGILAVAYAEAGRLSDAVVTAQKAHALALAQGQKDVYVEAELELAKVSIDNQQPSDAINHYQRVLAVDANSVAALSSLAWLRATASDPRLRDGGEAVRLAERACQLTQNKEASLVGILAAAYAEAGRFDEAVITAEKARAQALLAGQKDVATRTEQLLKLYKSGQPYHQEAKPAP